MHLSEDIITNSLKKEQFQILIDSFDYPIYVLNRDFRIVMVNTSLLKLSEEFLHPSEYIGEPIDTIPFISASIINNFKKVFTTGETFTSLERIKTNSNTFFIETRKIPIFSGNKVEKIMTLVIDIVNNDERGYKSLVNNIPVGVYRIIAPSMNSVRIKVEDNGAGIKAENLETIFEPFVSFDSKYCPKGSGIGLFLSRAFIEKMNGALIASSLGEDQGSIFTIELPRVVI